MKGKKVVLMRNKALIQLSRSDVTSSASLCVLFCCFFLNRPFWLFENAATDNILMLMC